MTHRIGAGAPSNASGPRGVRWQVVGSAALVALAVPLAAVFATAGDVLAAHVFWGCVVGFDALAAGAGTLLARRLGPPPARRFWWSVVAAAALFALGDLGYALARLGHAPALAGPLTAGRELAMVVGIAGVLLACLTYPSGQRRLRERVAYWLDTSTVLVGAAVFRWYLAADTESTAENLVTAVVLLLAAFAGARMAVSAAPPTSRLPALLLVVSTTLELACDVLGWGFPPDGSAGPAVLVRLAPAWLVPLAVLAPLGSVEGGRPRVRDQARRRPYSLLPYLMVAAVFALLVSTLSDARLRAQAVGVVVGAVVIVVLVVVRQLVAFRENDRLLRRVDETLSEVRRHERRLRALLEHSSDITTIVDAGGRFTYVSPAVFRILGHRAEDVRGQSTRNFVHPDDDAGLRPLLRQLAASPGHTVSYQARYRHADGSWRWLEVISTNRIDEPDVGGLVSNSREVTEARELQERLRHQASHDPLTQLANRALFTEHLGAAVRLGRRRGAPVAVLMVDMDDFKGINDGYGHHAGDAALRLLADRLRDSVRVSDTAARLGGDEFAVLLPDTTTAEADVVARRFLETLHLPADVDGHRLRLSASVGVAATRDGEAEELLRAADAAMYTAKQQGKNRFVSSDATAARRPAVRP
ncbi:MAG TPA: diguanylate cyclase [Pilimelia sp.]|nr:diguanylate cyclase [Pilimelia sp.]